MTNTFYKPRNEHGELLASEEYVLKCIDNAGTNTTTGINKLIDEVRGEIVKSETALRNEITTTNNLISETKNELNDNINSIDNTIRNDISEEFNTTNERIETLETAHTLNFLIKSSKVDLISHFAAMEPTVKAQELSRTIALIDKGNEVYEEWICTNIADVQNGVEPKWDKLGSIESYIAGDSKNEAYAMGLVKLVGAINTSNWNEYIEKNTEGYATSGLAVAPIALKAFHERIKHLEDEVGMSADDIELESRIDSAINTSSKNSEAIEKLNSIIGIDECCESDCGDDCKILCRLDAIETNIQTQDEFDSETNDRISTIEGFIGEITDDNTLESQLNELQNNIIAGVESFQSDINTQFAEYKTECGNLLTGFSATIGGKADKAETELLDSKIETGLYDIDKRVIDNRNDIEILKTSVATQFAVIVKATISENDEIELSVPKLLEKAGKGTETMDYEVLVNGVVVAADNAGLIYEAVMPNIFYEGTSYNPGYLSGDNRKIYISFSAKSGHDDFINGQWVEIPDEGDAIFAGRKAVITINATKRGTHDIIEWDNL